MIGGGLPDMTTRPDSGMAGPGSPQCGFCGPFAQDQQAAVQGAGHCCIIETAYRI